MQGKGSVFLIFEKNIRTVLDICWILRELLLRKFTVSILNYTICLSTAPHLCEAWLSAVAVIKAKQSKTPGTTQGRMGNEGVVFQRILWFEKLCGT